MDIKEIASALYYLAADIDINDYDETKEEELQEIENTLYFLRDHAEINPAANKHFKTFLNCLEAIASTH